MMMKPGVSLKDFDHTVIVVIDTIYIIDEIIDINY